MAELPNVKTLTLTDTLKYGDVPLLSYRISYPQFSLGENTKAFSKINRYYEDLANSKERYYRETLYPQAVVEYMDAMEQDMETSPAEAVIDFTVTFTSPTRISLYYDQYLYTGGAHGSTYRYSDTWDIEEARLMTLKEFFPDRPTYRQDIIRAIADYIGSQVAEDEESTIYFEDYQENVREYFSEENFYLIPGGIVIYFQQYELGPYSSGILQFLLPDPQIKE